MNMRKITSLTVLLSFCVVILTSIILYIAPQGRVAYWADWRLMGLSKEQWGAIHINVGFLFLLFLLIHVYYNWRPIVLYLNNKAKKLVVFTKEFNVALILTIVFILGTYIKIPPFSTIIDISNSFKDSGAVKYGEPPYGHAELSSLTTFTKKMDIDLAVGIKLLKESGYKVANETQTLQEIAINNAVSPQQLYSAMNPQPFGKIVKLPESPPPGTGTLTLDDFCSQYNLDVQTILKSFRASGIVAKEDMTIKSIGEINKTSPVQIYEKIKSIAHLN